MTVRALVERQAAERPDAIYALATETGVSLSFGELAASCRSVCAWLARQGLVPGATVSLVMPNGLGTLRLLLGAMWGGHCVNPVNLLAQGEQMRYTIAHSDCALVLVAPDWLDRVNAATEGLAVAVRVVDPDVLALDGPGDGPDAAAPPQTDDIALLMYTSGTTGLPKGVMLSHSNLVANALSVSAEHGLTSKDRVLGVLPLYHINAFVVTMLAPLAHGGSVALAPKFSAARFWDQAASSHCTWLNVVPTIVSYLLAGAVSNSTSVLKFCRSASAALPPEHLRGFEAKFSIGIVETMGLTETAAPSFSNPLDPTRRKLGAVGQASGCEARVVDAALIELPDGSTGEIVIRGPQVMRGYYKNPQATADAFTPDGWLRSGDLGHRDSNGFFFVTGRIKELIIKGGENIAPREIDEALLRHPAVWDAAAVGVPDPHYGQEIMACVVLRPGAVCSEDELRAFCSERLGRYKTPHWLHFVADLPRGPSGKVQRLKLAGMFAV